MKRPERITWSAPSKVILSGEHAVVYGKPAVVTSIGLYNTITITRAESDEPTKTEAENPAIHKAEEILKTLVLSYCKTKGIEVDDAPYSSSFTINAAIGRGLGTSASLAVAGIAAFYQWYTGKVPERDVINSLAYKAEKTFHENPSGVDNSICTYGGLLYYRREFEFLKTISLLPSKIPDHIQKNLYLIDSGKPQETTADMVRVVAEKYNNDNARIEKIINEIEKVTKRMVMAITNEDESQFLDCITTNNTLLTRLGVFSNEAEQLLSNLAVYGSGKITGAGGNSNGSGYVLFFAQDKEGLESYLNNNSISYIPLVQDRKGLHSYPDNQ